METNRNLIIEGYRTAGLAVLYTPEELGDLINRLASALHVAVRTGVCHCGEDIENHAAENHSPVEMIYERSTE